MKLSHDFLTALHNLFLIARRDTSEARYASSFLLGWEDRRLFGAFDLAHLQRLGEPGIKDIQTVMNMLFNDGFRRPSDLGFGPQIQGVYQLRQSENALRRIERRELAKASSKPQSMRWQAAQVMYERAYGLCPIGAKHAASVPMNHDCSAITAMYIGPNRFSPEDLRDYISFKLTPPASDTE